MVELPDLNEERRPRQDGAQTPATKSLLIVPVCTVNLVDLDPRERDIFWEGYTSGYCAGHEAGYARCDAELAALQRYAHRILGGLAKVPERDREADRARRERIEARWSS